MNIHGDHFWALYPAPEMKLSVRLKFQLFLIAWTVKNTPSRTSSNRVGEGTRSKKHPEAGEMSRQPPSPACVCQTENAIWRCMELLGTKRSCSEVCNKKPTQEKEIPQKVVLSLKGRRAVQKAIWGNVAYVEPSCSRWSWRSVEALSSEPRTHWESISCIY